ncbi:glycosyltransferase [Leucobacter japonicus]|uniref:glycosyltransferase n=1 Tax=Leucobacter japonicus TaxID=1461259 RepID=UPI0006A7E6A1|nr:glycosyltransferase [Leucobacter japonicus]
MNFGDELGPLIIRAMLARRGVEGSRATISGTRLLSVGSIMHFARRGDVVWGSGINGKQRAMEVPEALDVRSVRGPLSAAVLMSYGIDAPEVYGDPALLLARLFPEFGEQEGSGEHLWIPNLNEWDEHASAPDGFVTVDPYGDPLEIVRRIARASFVAASSLHGLIVADAYGVPARPVVPRIEHSFKYFDYYAGTGRPEVSFAADAGEALALGATRPARVDLDVLEASFPGDLWDLPKAPLSTPPKAKRYSELLVRSAQLRDEFARVAAQAGAGSSVDALMRAQQLLSSEPIESGITREEARVLGLNLPHLESFVTSPDVMLSVVVPTHNVEPWIAETLDSILVQDVEGMEVIVVDDHSADRTTDIVAEYVQRDARVTLIRSLSRGGGTARNVGVDHARGKYLVFSDGDDIIPDGAYRALVKSLEDSGSDIAVGDYLKFRPVDTWRPTERMAAFNRPQQRTYLTKEPSLLYSRPCWNKAFSRGWWESRHIRFPDVPRSNDIVPMVQAYLLARRIDFIPEVVYVYRERPGGSSMTSQSASTTSMLSYLSQERECAQLIVTAHHQQLNNVYASLVYDRDTYVQVVKYLAAWEEPTDADEAVCAAIDQLVRATPRPPKWVSPLKHAIVRLAGLGELRAARSMTRWESAGERVLDGHDLAESRHAIEVLHERGLLKPRLQHRIADLLVAALTLEIEPEHQRGWKALVDSLSHRVSDEALAFLPESRAAKPELRDVMQRKAEAAARVTGLFQRGASLVVHGESTGEVTGFEPVLHAAGGETSDVIAPVSVTWDTASGERASWTAEFRISDLTRHRRWTPGMRFAQQAKTIASLPSQAPTPLFRPTDAVLFELAPGRIIIRRRYPLVLRAAKRAPRLLKQAVRRYTGSGR